MITYLSFLNRTGLKIGGEFDVQQIMQLAQSQAPLDITFKNTSNTDVDFIIDNDRI